MINPIQKKKITCLVIICLCTMLLTNLSLANVFVTTPLIKQIKPPSLSIIGEYAIEENSSSYEVLADTDSDGDIDIIKVSSNEDSTLLSVKMQINSDGVYSDSDEIFELNLPNQTNINLMDIYVEDIDGDGKKDLWFYTKTTTLDCHYSLDVSYIFKNFGNNDFELVNSFFSESKKRKYRTIIQFEDVNQDGLLDPLFYNLYSTNLIHQNYQLINEGDFAFAVTDKSLLPYITSLKAMDFNNDGHTDFISSSNFNTSCQTIGENIPNLMNFKKGVLWLSDGNGGYQPSDSTLPISKASGVWVFDINNDQKSDVLLTYRDNEGKDKSVLYFSDSENLYSRKFEFDDVVTRAESADLNNNGKLDIVIKTKILVHETFYQSFAVVYENMGDELLVRGNELLLNFTNELILRDMNDDGKIDILGGIINLIPTYPAIYYNEDNFKFSDAQLIGDGYQREFSVSDVDNDGLPDFIMFSRYTGGTKFLKNHGNKDFRLVQPDFTDENFGLINGKEFQFSSVISEDLDSDGKEDFITVANQSISKYEHLFYLHVLSHESKINSTEYYNNSELKVMSLNSRWNFYKKSPNFEIADFNKDGLKDILVSGDGEINLLTQISNPPFEDIYYDSERKGHGFSIENIGRDNLFYTLFYSYDESGNSEWYIQLNTLMSNRNGMKLYRPNFDMQSSGNIISYKYDYSTQSAYINGDENKTGYIEAFYSNNELSKPTLDFKVGNEDVIQWNSQKLINKSQKPENDFSGLWWAGNGDAGWGLSLNFVQEEDNVVVFAVLYFYDAEGNARWIVGQAENFKPEERLTIQMNMINGYGRNQNSVELTNIPAGTITINLSQPSQDLSQSGFMSMNVFYPNGQRRDWVRNNIPFALFSKPRD